MAAIRTASRVFPVPPRPGQREQTRPPEQLHPSSDLHLPTHERRQLGGEVHRDLKGPEWRELVEETVDHDIVEVLGVNEVLEPVGSLASHRDAVGEIVLDQRTRGVGEDDLPTPSRGGDAGRPVNIEPDVVVATGNPLPGVHADAHPKRAPMWPSLFGEGALCRHGSR